MNLIIIPVHNEAETINNTVMGIYKFCDGFFKNKDFEFVIINDRSTDKTFETINQFDGKKVRVINNMFDQGKGSALKTGVVLSTMLYGLKPDDNIIFIDGDGQIRPKEIKVMFDLMKLYDADAVIGNKRHKYSMTQYTTARRIISQTYNKIIKFLFDLKLEDTQCGIKIFKFESLNKVIDRVNTKKYAFDLELLVALRANNYRIVDAPVTIRPQMNRGSISIGAVWRTFFDTIRVWINLKKSFYACQ